MAFPQHNPLKKKKKKDIVGDDRTGKCSLVGLRNQLDESQYKPDVAMPRQFSSVMKNCC